MEWKNMKICVGFWIFLSALLELLLIVICWNCDLKISQKSEIMSTFNMNYYILIIFKPIQLWITLLFLGLLMLLYNTNELITK